MENRDIRNNRGNRGNRRETGYGDKRGNGDNRDRGIILLYAPTLTLLLTSVPGACLLCTI